MYFVSHLNSKRVLCAGSIVAIQNSTILIIMCTHQYNNYKITMNGYRKSTKRNTVFGLQLWETLLSLQVQVGMFTNKYLMTFKLWEHKNFGFKAKEDFEELETENYQSYAPVKLFCPHPQRHPRGHHSLRGFFLVPS